MQGPFGGREDALASRSRFTASGASAPSLSFLGQPRSSPAAASSSFPSPWHCLALTLRSFFSRRAGCWEVQWAVAAPAAQLGEERGPGRAREAAREARFCEFCRWGAEEGCRLGGGRCRGGRGGVMMVLNVAAQLPRELPERRVRSPADSACSAPDAPHRGQEPLPAPPLSTVL